MSRLLDEMAALKSELIQVHKKTPQYLHMSPLTYMSIRTELGSLVPYLFIEERTEYQNKRAVFYGGMEIIVNNKMEANAFDITCSVYDEIDTWKQKEEGV